MKNKKKKPDERTLQVLDALNRLGGCGSPSAICKVMDCSSWGTKTPDATIRQKLQFSRGSLFFSVKKGVWCTKAWLEHNQLFESEMNNLKERVSAVEKKKSIVNIYAEGINCQNSCIEDRSEVVLKEKQTEDKTVETNTPKSKTKIPRKQGIKVTIESKREQILQLLDECMEGKTGKEATMVILAAVKAGAIFKPSYPAFDARYPDRINKNHYHDYTKSERSYDPVSFQVFVDKFKEIIEA